MYVLGSADASTSASQVDDLGLDSPPDQRAWIHTLKGKTFDL